MADKLSTLALREVGSYGEVKDAVVEKLLDKYSPTIAKQAAARERASLLTKLGAQTLEEASQLATLRQERDARPTASEEAKHGRFRFYQGVAVGGIVFSAITCLAIFAMQGVIWDTAARSFREQAMTGAILSAGERELP
jgi:hypothetical protein